MRKWIAFAASASLLCACGHKKAEQDKVQDVSAIPRVVEDVRQSYVLDCMPDLPHFSKNLIQAGDLNGDGALDYVVSAFDYQCRHDLPYCGTGGCEVQVFVSDANGALEKRFADYLTEPPRMSGAMLLSGRGPEKLRFDVDKAEFVPAQ